MLGFDLESAASLQVFLHLLSVSKPSFKIWVKSERVDFQLSTKSRTLGTKRSMRLKPLKSSLAK